MSRQQSAIHSFSRRAGATRAITWAFSHILPRVDPVVLKLTRGRQTLSTMLAGFPEVVVTTIGVRSGRPRTAVLLCIRDPEDSRVFAVVASNWGKPHNPAWYYNLRAHPRATCTLDCKTHAYVAHEAEGEEYAKFWRIATDTYRGYSLYKKRAGTRHIPIVVLTPA